VARHLGALGAKVVITGRKPDRLAETVALLTLLEPLPMYPSVLLKLPPLIARLPSPALPMYRTPALLVLPPLIVRLPLPP
jgi:hypothetical protein